MDVICLGGAGRICRETALELVRGGVFSRVTVADINASALQQVTAWLQAFATESVTVDSRIVDVTNQAETVAVLKGYDLVVDGLTISLNRQATACIAEAGCHGINFNGFGEEYAFDAQFKANGRLMVPGFGMTPGTTNMMALAACALLDEVESVRISHGSFRPIAFSAAIAETTTYEYDPQLPGRTVFENGEFVQVPPFARERFIELPEPYGTLPQYIIPHSETFTLAKYLKSIDKVPNLIEVRGTWPAENMQLIRALYDWGILKNESIRVNGTEVGVMDCVAQFLQQSAKGRETALYGYALHVEVEGMKDGEPICHTLYHTHPASDGLVPEWSGLRAYTRNVGLPVAVAAELMVKGDINDVSGVSIPECVFEPSAIFDGLRRFGLDFHQQIKMMEAN